MKNKTNIKTLIELEKQLLIFEDKYKLVLPLNTVIRLNKALESIGNITNIYFNLLDAFSSEIALKCVTEDECILNKSIEDYNIKLQTDNIDFDTDEITSLIDEIKNYIN